MALPLPSAVGVALDISIFATISERQQRIDALVNSSASDVTWENGSGPFGQIRVAVADSRCQSVFSFFTFPFLSFGPKPLSIRAGERVHKSSLVFSQTEGTARDHPMRTCWFHA